MWALSFIMTEGMSAAPQTTCASCEMIILLLHCVQHLLISIMGYAPMHRANPERESSFIWLIWFRRLYSWQSRFGEKTQTWLNIHNFLPKLTTKLIIQRLWENSRWTSLGSPNPPLFFFFFSSRSLGSRCKGRTKKSSFPQSLCSYSPPAVRGLP